MKTTLISATALTLLAAPAFAAEHASPASGYALTDDGMALVMLPGLVEAGDKVMLEGQIDAIAYRPVTGELIGVTRAGQVYGIDVTTGTLTDLGATIGENAMASADAAVGLDFNNAIDAVRAVSSDGANLVYFPTGFGDNDERANSVLRFTDLFYADGDVNAGTTPMIYANAYTNAVNGATQETTAQYVLDAATDSLVTLANNDGTLGTVAKITIDGIEVDLAHSGGFDIVSPEADTNTAYAVLMMEGADMSGLYSIDLETGAAIKTTDLEGSFTGFAAMLPTM
ncbi:DUF4394 domain-containing protein [Yoonia sp. MH D7]